jgi:RecB family exonuclease
MDALIQGGIVHKTLAQWLLEGQPLESLFQRVFQAACEEERIPPGYRTEAVRLELLRTLDRFIKEARLPGSWKSDVEQSFELKLDDGLILKGRIDRIDLAPDGKALVIDYKYSGPEKIRERVKAHEDGSRIQGGAYMLAVGQRFGKEVAGMLFAGLRKRVTWDGWHIPLAGLERVGHSHKPEGLRELFEQAKQTTLDTAREIREGRVAPRPADPKLCEHCDFRDVCRVETAARVRTAQEVEE